ncbi:MAG: DoxX family protein [Pseudomonadales bacterium]|nr:DoxX family protein [Pseudomonadales bacterium]MCP5182785.1 DoxX family protein [Pseudomonadales bacterium]
METSLIEQAGSRLATLGRVLLGLYFIVPGVSKIVGFAQTSAYMADHHVPFVPVLLVLTIVLQVGGGLSLAANYRTRLVAFLLAGLTLIISLFMHNFWSYPDGLERAHETQNFVKNLAIMAGLLLLVAPQNRSPG